jgi:hypothetical protein
MISRNLLFIVGSMFGWLLIWPENAIATKDRYQFCIVDDANEKLVTPYDQTCKGPGRTPARSLSRQPSKRGSVATEGIPQKQQNGPATPPVSSTAANGAASQACPEGFSTRLVIGDSFNDLNFMNTAVCNPAPAKGAQFSFARDGVADNRQWLAKGTVAYKFIWLNSPDNPDEPYLNLFAAAPFVSFNRVVNSNAKLAKTQDVDVLSYGFSSEALYAGVRDLFERSWQVYVRARAKVNGTFEGETKSWATTFEIQPLSDAYFIGSNIPLHNFGYLWIHPMVRAQYFQRLNGSTDPIFARGDEVLRAGPVVALSLIPQPMSDADPNKPPPAPQWILNLTYSWYRDFMHGQEFQYWNPSFTYNFTENIGLTIGYEKGKVETTGKRIDLTTISLSVKN